MSRYAVKGESVFKVAPSRSMIFYIQTYVTQALLIFPRYLDCQVGFWGADIKLES